MGVEVVTAEAWLFEQLEAAFEPLGLEVYTDAGPEDAPYPFVVFAYLDATDRMSEDGNRIFTRMDYAVRIADRVESLLPLMAGAELIDMALHKEDGPSSGGGAVLSCVREEPFRQREVIDGSAYLSLGGIYRLLVGG